MPFKSFINKAKSSLDKSKKEICETMGNLVTAEAQNRATVLTGNMRRSITYEVMGDNSGLNVGVTMDAEYAPYVEKGTSKQAAQPFLEPAVMDNISKLEDIAKQKITVNMGGE